MPTARSRTGVARRFSGQPAAAGQGMPFDPYGPCADAHPTVRRQVEAGYLPRRNLIAEARQTASGLYGGVEYMNLRINRASQLVGNEAFNPFADRVPGLLNATDLNTAFDQLVFDASPSRAGSLDLSDPILVSPYPLVTELDTVGIQTANPFFFPLETINGGVTPNLDPSNATLFIANPEDVNFSNVSGIRGTVGYTWANGLITEASVFGLHAQDSLFSTDLMQNGDGGIDLSFDFDGTDNFDSDGGDEADVFDAGVDGGSPVGVDPDDGRRRRVGLIPVEVLDFPAGTDAAGSPLAAPSIRPLFYDTELDARHRTDMIGTQGDLIVPVTPNTGRFRTDFSVGFRYLNMDESLFVSATQDMPVFDNVAALSDEDALTGITSVTPGFAFAVGAINSPRTTVIDASTQNNLYAAKLGTRSELDLAPFTIGVAPSVSLGVNSADTTVRTSQLFDVDDPLVRRSATDAHLAAAFDLDLYAKLRLRDWLSATVGYNLMVVGGVQRAPDAVDYSASLADPGLGVRSDASTLVVDGLTVGFEVLLP